MAIQILAIQILPVLAQTEVWQQQIYFNSCPLLYFCRILPSLQLLDIFVEHLSGKAKAQSLEWWTSEAEFIGRAEWEICTGSLS